ncbi:Metallo-hydrolase/oxidoreductase [Meredithblackwellia eburnea MCA 4105]
MFRTVTTRLTINMLALPVVVSIPASSRKPESDSASVGGTGAGNSTSTKPAHHTSGGHFQNPWPSFVPHDTSIPGLYHLLKEWKSKPVPPPDQLPQVLKPNWGHNENPTPQDVESWRRDIKATWLGHACFLVEFPTPTDSTGRGPRVLFDPVFSQRCSPSQYIGPARITQPPIPMKEIPEVDAVILSHNHYDHTDVATLKHLYAAQPKGTVHFFAPLGNAKWFKSLGFASQHVTELDWWDERDVTVTTQGVGEDKVQANLRVTCTPCQHFTGRFVHDHFHTLWASWAVELLPNAGAVSASGPRVWFGGDTGFKSVPRGVKTEEGLPTCPAFKEIGAKFGSFDLSMIPIGDLSLRSDSQWSCAEPKPTTGAYDPRWAMSRIHCSPEDSVELHLDVGSKKSVGMHWGTWILTSEEMTEPPKRLRSACEAKGLTKADFDVCDIGETVRATPSV